MRTLTRRPALVRGQGLLASTTALKLLQHLGGAPAAEQPGGGAQRGAGARCGGGRTRKPPRATGNGERRTTQGSAGQGVACGGCHLYAEHCHQVRHSAHREISASRACCLARPACSASCRVPAYPQSRSCSRTGASCCCCDRMPGHPSCKLRHAARCAACDGTTGCCGLASTGQWDAMGALQVARDTSVRAAALSGSWAANHRACSHFRHPAAVVAACCGSPGLPCYCSLNSCSAGCGQAGAPPANTRPRATEGRCRRHAAAACRPARVERARSSTQAALLRATGWSTTGPWVWRRALCKGRHGRTRQRPLPRRLRDLLLRVVVRHVRNGDGRRAGALKRDIPPAKAGGGQAGSEDRAAHMGRGTNGALEGGRLTARCRPGPAHLMTTPASKRTGPLTVRLVAALRLGATLTRRSSLSTSL